MRYLPEEALYVVQVRHFRGQIEVEEAAFFVRTFDTERGEVRLSDKSRELLDVASLRLSAIDGALLCRIKPGLVPQGVLARFTHSAHAELLLAVEESTGGPCLHVAGTLRLLPAL